MTKARTSYTVKTNVGGFVAAVAKEYRQRAQVFAAMWMRYAELMASGPGGGPGGWPGTRSGRLAKSYRVNLKPVAAGFEVVLTNAAPYSLALQNGTRARTVRPVRALALHWIGQDGGDVFAKEVRIGPVAPRPHLTLATQGFRPEFRRMVVKPMRIKDQV